MSPEGTASPLCFPALIFAALTMLLQGIFYEIDSKNDSCEKKKLHCSMHPLDIPDAAKFHGLMTVGNPSIDGEGLKVNIWTGQMLDSKGKRGALRVKIVL